MAGCAVLATNTGGIPDLIKDGVNGMLVPVDAIDAAASALKQLLQDAPLRARLAREARECAKTYDWDGISAKYAAVYEAL